MAGRYGPYVRWGKVNATLPKDTLPEDLSMAAALELIADKAAKSGKGTKKPAAKKPAAKGAKAAKAAAGTAAKPAAKPKADKKPATKTAAKPSGRKTA
jgi:DNA topoisomerase-1